MARPDTGKEIAAPRRAVARVVLPGPGRYRVRLEVSEELPSMPIERMVYAEKR